VISAAVPFAAGIQASAKDSGVNNSWRIKRQLFFLSQQLSSNGL